MADHERPASRGLRLHDLVGLVIGYGMAALLARSFWSRDRPLTGAPAIVLGLVFLWLGLAMSGPIVLLFDRRVRPETSPRPRKPTRPGRLISSVRLDEPAVGRVAMPPPEHDGLGLTRAELSWLLIGGYWIAMTLLVVPATSLDKPWALAGLIPFVATLGLLLVVPGRSRGRAGSESWTHRTAVVLLWTWPLAWIFLIILGSSL